MIKMCSGVAHGSSTYVGLIIIGKCSVQSSVAKRQAKVVLLGFHVGQ